MSVSVATSVAEPVSPKNERLRAVLASHVFQVGAGIVLFWVLCAVVGPGLVPYNPYGDDLMNALAPPTLAHLFGTDQIGRDIFSRVIVGSRAILSIAPLATLTRQLSQVRPSG